MKPQTRFPILLGSLLVLLCALLAWGIFGRRPSSLPPADPNPRTEATGHAAVPLVSSPAPSADVSVSPRLQLERRCLALAEQDPLAAMELALKNNLTADDPGLLTSLIMQWASRDFDAAYDWTKTQEAGAWRDNTLAHVSYFRAKTDPVAAARIVVTDIQAGRARDEAIISVVHQWALQDAEAAGLWAQSLADETLRQRASAEVAGLAAASSSRPIH
jgi:hypothetical protein